MSLRFRKSLSLGKGLRLNLSKSGVGVSAGFKGLRVGVGSKGAYTSTSIPGTGLYSINYAGTRTGSSQATNSQEQNTKKGCLFAVFAVLEIFLIATVPPLGIVLIIGGVIWYISWSRQPKQKAAKLFERGKVLFNQDMFEDAFNVFTEAYNLFPENKHIARMMAASLHNNGKFDEAIIYFKEYLNDNESDFYNKIVLANCYYQAKKYDEAIALLQTLPDEYELDLKAIQILGGSFAEKGQYDLAISVFKKAPLGKRNLDEELKELHYNLGLIYEKSGDKQSATKHFKRVYSEDINYQDVAQKIEQSDKSV